MLIYFLIFILKITENALSTLRIIVISNGKKKLGAILQGIVSLVWIFSISIVIIGINEDLLKIVFFILGSIMGSYLGSLIEEKIALGNNLIICIVKEMYENEIKQELNNYKISTICEKNNTYSILLIMLKRKDITSVNDKIKSIDNNAIIISEKAKFLSKKV